MHFSNIKRKGLPDRKFGFRKVFVRGDTTHQQFVERCKSITFPDAKSEESATEYYITDGSGNRLDESLVIQVENGGTKTIPWTYDGYLKARGVKYPSKIKFYSVQRIQGLPCSRSVYT